MGSDDQAAGDPLTAWMDAGDRRPLQQASEAEASSSLRRLMAEQESLHPDIDGERLARASWALENAGKPHAPAVALAWLQERPSHARLDVILSVLLVSWTPAPGAPPPDPALVEALFAVHDRLPRDPITENGLLIVLMRAGKAGLPAPLEAKVRAFLERARQVPDRQAEVRAMLDAFLNAG